MNWLETMAKIQGDRIEITAYSRKILGCYDTMIDNLSYPQYLELQEKFGLVEDTEEDIVGRMKGLLNGDAMEMIEDGEF